MSRYGRLGSTAPSLILTLIMIVSVFAGPVSASLGTASDGSLQDGPPIHQVDVPDDQLTQASENISIWDGAFLSLRPNKTDSRFDTAAAYQVKTLDTYVETSVANQDLQKNPVYMYNQGSAVPFTFDGISNDLIIDGKKVQLVAAKVEKGATLPGSISGVATKLTNDDNVTSSVVGSTTGTDGTNEFSFTPEESGMWMFAVVAVEDGAQGFTDADGDGNLETNGNVTFVGVDLLPVQQGSSSVSTPSVAGNGENVSVGVDASSLGASEVSHTVMVFNETDLDNYLQIINASDRSNITLETEVGRYNGTTERPADANIMGLQPGAQSVSGSETAGTLFGRLIGSGGQFDSVTTLPPNATVYQSSVTKVGGAQTTVDVPIDDNATPGQYVVMHVATNQSGTDSVTSRSSVEVVDTVQLNLEVNTSNPVAGQDVKITVTRSDDGSPVGGATVTVNGRTVKTNANGVVTIRIKTPGKATATAAKSTTNGNVFDEDSVALDVQSPATFEYSNLSVNPQQVLVDEGVTVDATITNVGDVAGAYNASVTVDGQPVGTAQSASLDPNNSTDVSFTTSLDTSGTYDVAVDELSTTDEELIPKSVRVVTPANTSVSTVSVTPTSITSAERYTVNATVENTGGLSDTVTVTFTVTNETGELVLQRDKTLSVGADSSKQVAISTLAPQSAIGTDRIENFTVDVDGVEADSKLTVTIPDTESPSVRLRSPSTGETNYGTPITVTVTDSESDVESATYDFGNGPKSLSLDTNGNATIQTDSLTEGEQTLVVNATDTSGNTISRTFTFDFVSSPRITGVAPTGVAGPSSALSATFADDRNGDADTGINASATTLLVNGNEANLGDATTASTSTLEIDLVDTGVTLTEGVNTAKLTVVDNAGHATSRVFEFEYDETAPTTSISQDLGNNDEVSANNTINVTLDTADQHLESAAFVVERMDGTAVYTRDVTSLAKSTDNAFTIQWNGTDDSGAKLSQGDYNLTLVSTDAAGNSAVGNVTVPVDNQLPVYDIPAVNGTDGTVYTNSSINVTYNTSEPAHVTYTLVSSSGVSATFTRVTNKATLQNHTLDVTSKLPDGIYGLKATVTDTANNTVTVYRNKPVVVDTASPGLAGTLNINETTGNLTVNVTSTEAVPSTPVATITYPDSSQGTPQLTRAGPRSWTTQLDTNASGEYLLDVSVTDRSGNIGSDTGAANVSGHDFQTDKSVLIVSSSGETFININASETADLPAGETVITLSETNISPTTFTEGSDATQYIDANTQLNDSQIDEVTYGFSESLDTSGDGFYIVYIRADGTEEVLPTDLKADPLNVSGNYYVATRGGLSTYGAYPNDTSPPTVTYDTPVEGATFEETDNEVDVNATLDDNVEVNTSSVTVTLDSDGQITDLNVTSEAAITNESVNYTSFGLPPANYTVSIHAADTNLTANTVTEQVNFTIQDDREPPTFTDFNPAAPQIFPYGTTTVPVNGTYEEATGVNDTGIDEENVVIRYDGEDITSSSTVTDTGFETNVTVSDTETHNVTVRVPDNAGNAVIRTVNFSVSPDDTDPAVEITTPQEGTELSNTTTSVNVTASVADTESGVNLSSVTVTFDGTDKTSAANLDDLSNVWFNKSGLEPGTSHTVVVSAADKAGNTDVSTVNFTVAPDTTAPNVTRVSSAGETYNSTENFTVLTNYTDPESGIDASTVKIKLDGTDITKNATISANPGAAVELNATDIGSGTHSLTVSVTNNNGDTTLNQTTFDVNEGPDLLVNSASLNATDVFTGDDVEVTASAENVGDETGTFDLGVAGDSQAGTTDFGVTKTVELAPGETTTETFVISSSTAGTYTVGVNGTNATNTLTVTSPTADIQVLSSSAASPTQLLENEETTVTVKLGNLGDASGTIDGNVTRNGTTIGNISTSLATDAQKTFTFNDTPPAPGDYVYAFEGTEIETITVEQRAPAFSIASTSLSGTTVETGEKFTVSVTVKNKGTAQGTTSKALKANSTTLATKSATIAAGSSKKLTFTVKIGTEGTYDLTVDGVSIGTLTVEAKSTGDDGTGDGDTGDGDTGNNAGGGGGGGGGNAGPPPKASGRYDSGQLSYADGYTASLPNGSGVTQLGMAFGKKIRGQVLVREIDGIPGTIGTPKGEPVGWLRIEVPEDAEETQSTLTFRVRQSKLDDLDVTASDLRVVRYNDDTGEWETLETRVTEKGDDAVVLEADTPGFSYFGVVAQQVSTTTTTPGESTTTTDEWDTDDTETTTTTTDSGEQDGSTTTTSSSMPGFGVVVALVALIALALVAVRRD